VATATVAPLAGGASTAPPLPTEAVIVATGQAPCGAAARAGSVWVGVYGAGTLLRVDPGGRIEARVRVGRSACRVAIGPSAVWVTRDDAGEVVRISLGSGRLLRVKVGAVPFDVLRSDGFVWVTNWRDGTVMKIRPGSGVPMATVRVGAYPTGLARCSGRIWVGHGRGATRITSVDPTSLRMREIFVGATPEWPHCIGGALWVTTTDSVLRLDVETGHVLSRLRIGETLADAAGGPDGLVWVTDKEHSLVYRVTPNGRAVVDSFPAGPGAFALARDRGSMWVTSFAGSDVRRFDP
jgi:streptogramin lyase